MAHVVRVQVLVKFFFYDVGVVSTLILTLKTSTLNPDTGTAVSFHLTLRLSLRSAMAWISADRHSFFPSAAALARAVRPSYMHVDTGDT